MTETHSSSKANRKANTLHEMAASRVLYFYCKLVAFVRQATQTATMNAEDLEEVWERAITVARVDLPNRCARGGAWGWEEDMWPPAKETAVFCLQLLQVLALKINYEFFFATPEYSSRTLVLTLLCATLRSAHCKITKSGRGVCPW